MSLRGLLGLAEWPKDATRHSAGTYWLAINGNPLHMAEQLGHSVSELTSSYRALVTRTDAERFWAIAP